MREFLIPVLIFSCISCSANKEEKSVDWCDHLDLSLYEGIEEVPIKDEWFKVYRVGEEVYAIAEPYNFEEVISYLILGKEKALLFDTGMGMSSMASVVKELTDLPVTVLNSHAHYDHIGGNYEFNHIIAVKTDYNMHWSEQGWSHDLVKNEVSPEAFCSDMLPLLDTANYHIKAYPIFSFIEDGHIIELGGRDLEVIAVPGHSPDAIALLDIASGYLWTGDTYYEGPIWLYFEGTDLDAYGKSIEILAQLSPGLEKVFPAHNMPTAKPERLQELSVAFKQVLNGTKKPRDKEEKGLPVYDEQEKMVYEFEHFSFLIRRDHLTAKGIIDQAN